MSHNFGFAVQAPVGIHEPWREEVVVVEGGRGEVVVVAEAGVERGRAGSGWVLYKEVRTPNSQFQWDFPSLNLRSTRSPSNNIYRRPSRSFPSLE